MGEPSLRLAGKIVSVGADVDDLNYVEFELDGATVRAGFFVTHCAVDYRRVPDCKAWRESLQACLRINMAVTVLSHRAFPRSTPDYMAVVSVRNDKLFSADKQPFILPLNAVVSHRLVKPTNLTRILDQQSFEGIVDSMSPTFKCGTASFKAFGKTHVTNFQLKTVTCGRHRISFGEYESFKFVGAIVELLITKTFPDRIVKYEADGDVFTVPSAVRDYIGNAMEGATVVAKKPPVAVKPQNTPSATESKPPTRTGKEHFVDADFTAGSLYLGVIIDLTWNPNLDCFQPSLLCLSTCIAKHLVFVPQKNVRYDGKLLKHISPAIRDVACCIGMHVVVSHLRRCEVAKLGAHFKGRVELESRPWMLNALLGVELLSAGEVDGDDCVDEAGGQFDDDNDDMRRMSFCDRKESGATGDDWKDKSTRELVDCNVTDAGGERRRSVREWADCDVVDDDGDGKGMSACTPENDEVGEYAGGIDESACGSDSEWQDDTDDDDEWIIMGRPMYGVKQRNEIEYGDWKKRFKFDPKKQDVMHGYDGKRRCSTKKRRDLVASSDGGGTGKPTRVLGNYYTARNSDDVGTRSVCPTYEGDGADYEKGKSVRGPKKLSRHEVDDNGCDEGKSEFMSDQKKHDEVNKCDDGNSESMCDPTKQDVMNDNGQSKLLRGLEKNNVAQDNDDRSMKSACLPNNRNDVGKRKCKGNRNKVRRDSHLKNHDVVDIDGARCTSTQGAKKKKRDKDDDDDDEEARGLGTAKYQWLKKEVRNGYLNRELSTRNSISADCEGGASKLDPPYVAIPVAEIVVEEVRDEREEEIDGAVEENEGKKGDEEKEEYDDKDEDEEEKVENEEDNNETEKNNDLSSSVKTCAPKNSHGPDRKFTRPIILEHEQTPFTDHELSFLGHSEADTDDCQEQNLPTVQPSQVAHDQAAVIDAAPGDESEVVHYSRDCRVTDSALGPEKATGSLTPETGAFWIFLHSWVIASHDFAKNKAADPLNKPETKVVTGKKPVAARSSTRKLSVPANDDSVARPTKPLPNADPYKKSETLKTETLANPEDIKSSERKLSVPANDTHATQPAEPLSNVEQTKECKVATKALTETEESMTKDNRRPKRKTSVCVNDNTNSQPTKPSSDADKTKEYKVPETEELAIRTYQRPKRKTSVYVNVNTSSQPTKPASIVDPEKKPEAEELVVNPKSTIYQCISELNIKTAKRIPLVLRERIRQRKSCSLDEDTAKSSTAPCPPRKISDRYKSLESIQLPGLVFKIDPAQNVVVFQMDGSEEFAEFFNTGFTFNGGPLTEHTILGKTIKLGMRVTIISLYSQFHGECRYLALVDLAYADVLDYCAILQSACDEDESLTREKRKYVLKKIREIRAKLEPLCPVRVPQDSVGEDQKELVVKGMREMEPVKNGAAGGRRKRSSVTDLTRGEIKNATENGFLNGGNVAGVPSERPKPAERVLPRDVTAQTSLHVAVPRRDTDTPNDSRKQPNTRDGQPNISEPPDKLKNANMSMPWQNYIETPPRFVGQDEHLRIGPARRRSKGKVGTETPPELCECDLSDDIDILPAFQADPVDPSVKLAPSVPVEPSVKLAPSMQVDPSVKLAPSVQADPLVQVDMPVKLAPSGPVDPSVKLPPSMQVDPLVKLAPSVQVDPSVKLAPSMQVDPLFKLAPPVKVDPSVQVVPSAKVASLGHFDQFVRGPILAHTAPLVASPSIKDAMTFTFVQKPTKPVGHAVSTVTASPLVASAAPIVSATPTVAATSISTPPATTTVAANPISTPSATPIVAATPTTPATSISTPQATPTVAAIPISTPSATPIVAANYISALPANLRTGVDSKKILRPKRAPRPSIVAPMKCPSLSIPAVATPPAGMSVTWLAGEGKTTDTRQAATAPLLVAGKRLPAGLELSMQKFRLEMGHYKEEKLKMLHSYSLEQLRSFKVSFEENLMVWRMAYGEAVTMVKVNEEIRVEVDRLMGMKDPEFARENLASGNLQPKGESLQGVATTADRLAAISAELAAIQAAGESQLEALALVGCNTMAKVQLAGEINMELMKFIAESEYKLMKAHGEFRLQLMKAHGEFRLQQLQIESERQLEILKEAGRNRLAALEVASEAIYSGGKGLQASGKPAVPAQACDTKSATMPTVSAGNGGNARQQGAPQTTNRTTLPTQFLVPVHDGDACRQSAPPPAKSAALPTRRSVPVYDVDASRQSAPPAAKIAALPTRRSVLVYDGDACRQSAPPAAKSAALPTRRSVPAHDGDGSRQGAARPSKCEQGAQTYVTGPLRSRSIYEDETVL